MGCEVRKIAGVNRETVEANLLYISALGQAIRKYTDVYLLPEPESM